MREAVAVSKAVGVTTLDGLTDVTITSAATGDVLRYNGTAWVDAVLAIADTSGLQTALDAKLGGSLGSTDNRVLRADGTGGSTAQGSAVTIDDSGNVTGVAALTASGDVSANRILPTSGVNFLPALGNYGIFIGGGGYVDGLRFAWNGEILAMNGSRVNFGSNAVVSFSTTTASSGTPDLGYSRASAGVLEINNGTTGTLRDLSLRNLTASGTVNARSIIAQVAGTNSVDIEWNLNGVTLGSGKPLAWSPVSSASSSQAMSIINNGTTQIDVRASLGLRVRNVAGNADAPLSCSDIAASGLIGLGTYTVATLPSASANPRRIAAVTDSSVTTNGSPVAGGGTNPVIVFSNGTTWDVVVA